MSMIDPDRPLRLGTRASPLALAQAEMVRDALCAAHGWPVPAVELVAVTASGDRITDRALADVGGKALWTKELDAMLAGGDIDMAVHSMKDVETIRPDAFVIAAMLPRADVRDRIVLRPGLTFAAGGAVWDALPHGARVGTSSPRRAAQLRAKRADLVITLIRGNVATRLAKLAAGDCDATLLAAAGLDRLEMADVGVALDIADWLPAAAQGAIGIEARRDDSDVRQALNSIADHATMAAVLAERALLAALDGDCRSPVAAHAARDAGGALILRAQIYAPDGRVMIDGSCAGDDAAAIADLARDMLGRAPLHVRAVFGG
ncbi:MAG: hydroxymethylbilane synthase [Pseudomonadota bacterium]